MVCVCVSERECVCMCVYVRDGGALSVLAGTVMGQPGAPDMVVLLWPLVVSGLHDVIRSPWYAEVRMPTKRTQRLHVC